MKATDAIRNDILKQPPQITDDKLLYLVEVQKKHNQSIQPLRYPFNNIHQGKFQRFIQIGDSWYMLKDEVSSNGNAILTLDINGEFYRCIANDGDTSDSHHFLAWEFANGRWDIVAVMHSLADEQDFDKNTK
jgi:hypothetical protein